MAMKKPDVEKITEAAKKGIIIDWTEEPPDYTKSLETEDESDEESSG
mgnify:FL=1